MKRQYRAFISYSHADKAWGKWLGRKLETYRMPKGLKPGDRRLRPVFRDDDDMAARPDLWAEIVDTLKRSDTLVVICSPRSAKSSYVDDEIQEFRSLGRGDKIFGMIVDGVPDDSQAECLPPAFRADGKRAEPFAVDVRAMGKQDALLKLVAGIRGLEFDQLKRRDRRRATWRGAIAISVVVSILTAYAVSLLIQARAVNLQASSVLAALSSSALENGDAGRALRFAILSAQESPISPVAPDAEPTLIKAYYATPLLAEFREHDFSVYDVSFDGQSRRLLSASQDGTVRFYTRDGDGWREDTDFIDTGEQLATARFVGENDGVLSLPLSGSRLTFWQPGQSGHTEFSPFESGSGMIRAFGSSQDGTTVVLGYQSARVELWNYDDGDWRLVYTDAATPSVPTAAALSEDGDRFAVGDIDGNLTMYERGDDGKFASSPPIELMPSEVRRLHFSTSGKRALAVSLGAMSIASNEDERGWVTGARIASATDITNAAFLDVDGTQVLTNGNNSTARLWIETADANWTTAETFGSQERHARSLTVSPDGTVFATGGNDNPVVQIWGPAVAQDWRSFLKVTQGIGLVENVEDFTDGHTRFNAQPAISPNGLRIAIGDVYGIVTIRDKATDRELALIDASHNPQYGIAFSEDGTLLQILDGEGLYTGLDFPVEVAINLSGSELIQRVCRDRLGGTLAVLDESDTEVAPLLADRQAEDVCAPSNLWKQFVETIGFFLGVRPPQ